MQKPSLLRRNLLHFPFPWILTPLITSCFLNHPLWDGAGLHPLQEPAVHISSEAMLVVLYHEIGVLVGISKPWILAKATNQGFVSLKSQLLHLSAYRRPPKSFCSVSDLFFHCLMSFPFPCFKVTQRSYPNPLPLLLKLGFFKVPQVPLSRTVTDLKKSKP